MPEYCGILYLWTMTPDTIFVVSILLVYVCFLAYEMKHMKAVESTKVGGRTPYRVLTT